MEIKITTLSENTANYGYIGEWGLSILVETETLSVLLDTGQSISASHNAALLGVDLGKIDMLQGTPPEEIMQLLTSKK